MTAEEIFKTMQDLIAEQFAIDAEEITLDSSFVDDLGADSVDLVELVMAMEEEFDVGEIDEEIHQYEQGAVKHGDTQNDRVVPVVDAGDEVPAQSGNGKDGFDDETAGKNGGDHRSQIGDDRQQGIFQCMAPHDFYRSQAFGPGRSDIVL